MGGGGERIGDCRGVNVGTGAEGWLGGEGPRGRGGEVVGKVREKIGWGE